VTWMAARTDDSLATLLLTNHLLEREVQPLGPKAFWSLVEAAGNPSSLLGRSQIDLATDLGDEQLAARLTALLEASTQLAFALERSESQGFRALTPFDDGYPTRLRERLREQAPPILFAAGPIELLSRDAIGIVGSRNVSRQAMEVAAEAARAAATAGLAIVSGGARGVDQTSMSAGYQAAGSVIGYLAESLEKRVKAPETRKVIGEGVVCLATPFKPSAGFSVRNAMARNKLIYATARATLVVATDEGQGGTWAGAIEALRQSYGTVCVWMGEGGGPGNGALAERGAALVQDVGQLLDVSPPAHAAEPPEQLPMNF
jgi:predicted Rossmann fold nucleotide-binding protein DprA/Smf involved in DNA uptake